MSAKHHSHARITDDPIKRAAAESLKGMRRSSGLSQAEVAIRLGTTQGTISRWESGSSTPDVSDVAKYAAVCSTGDQLPGLAAAIKQARRMLGGEE